MKISYDYSELINELNEELEDCMLNLDDEIQILRGDIEGAGYKPIIDWYYDDTAMKKMAEHDISDSEQESNEKHAMFEQYTADKQYLQTITVRECLEHMYKMNEVV